jgi:hypothetical protein
MATYGIDTDANLLYTLLLSAEHITVPTLDLTAPVFNIPGDNTSGAYQQINPLTNADMTAGAIDGTGTFDVLMQGMKAQLREEFEKGRITGAEYTKAYVALVQSTMQFAVQYLLGRDQAYWQSVLAQSQAITARVGLEQAKIQAFTAQVEARNATAALALTKAKLGTEDAQFGQLKYQIDNLLPAQLTQVQAQTQVTNKQVALVGEQTEVQRAQTLDVRTDGQTVAGALGKQKQLYTQQITSYQRDAEVKAAKIFSDAWITMKTIDEGITAPAGFSNSSVDTVLTALKTNNGLG